MEADTTKNGGRNELLGGMNFWGFLGGRFSTVRRNEGGNKFLSLHTSGSCLVTAAVAVTEGRGEKGRDGDGERTQGTSVKKKEGRVRRSSPPPFQPQLATQGRQKGREGGEGKKEEMGLKRKERRCDGHDQSPKSPQSLLSECIPAVALGRFDHCAAGVPSPTGGVFTDTFLIVTK